MKRQLRTQLARAVPRRSSTARLAARVTALEAEVQESRRLHRRVAELTDIVQELLLPAAQRDEAKVRDLLQRYSSSL